MSDAIPDVNSNYRRAIGITLAMFDKTLCEFEQWAHGRELHSVLYLENNRLTPSQRETILAGIQDVRRILEDCKCGLKLDTHIEDAAGYIWSQCSGLWAALAEIGSERLKRYGEAPEGFAAYFDPHLSEVEKHLNIILDALKKR